MVNFSGLMEALQRVNIPSGYHHYRTTITPSPGSTVFDGVTSETIRFDHRLMPVIGIGTVDGRVAIDSGEVADFGR